MAKLGYTKRSRGGQYRQRSTGDDRQATAQEKRITDYLEKARQEQKTVRDEQLTDLRGVFSNEADNRDQLHKLEKQLRNAQEKNTEILAKRDVKRLEDEARQKQDEAEWWAEYSPTLAENFEKAAKGAWEFVAYHHDKDAIENAEKEINRAKAAEAFKKAELSVLGNAEKDKAKLQNEGTAESFHDAAKIDEDIWGELTRPLWGSKFTMERAKLIEENWDMLVSEAMGDTPFENQSADLIIARLGQIKRHLGIGRGTAGDRHIDKVARSRLNAWKKGRSQRIAVSKSDKAIVRTTDHFKSIKINWDTATPQQQMEYSQAIMGMVNAYNGRHEITAKGQYISPYMRGSNHGQAFDHMVMDLIKNHDLTQEQLSDIFKAHGMPQKKDEGMDYYEWVATKPPNWGKWRGPDKVKYFKDKLHEQNTIKLGNLQKVEQGKIDGQVLDAAAKLQEIDLDTEEGRRKAINLRNGKHPTVQAFISNKLQHDPKKHVPFIVHTNIKAAVESGNFEVFMDNIELLTKTQQALYETDMKRFQMLIGAGMDTKWISDLTESKLKSKIEYNPVASRNQSPYPEGYKGEGGALETGKQLFYSIAAKVDRDKYASDREWGLAIEEKWEKIMESDLFELVDFGSVDKSDPKKNTQRYKNFTSAVDTTEITKKQIEDASAKVGENWKAITTDQYGKLISDEDATKFIQAQVNGDNPSYPENVKTLAKLYGLTEAEVMRQWYNSRHKDGFDILGEKSLVIPPSRTELLEALGEKKAAKMSKEEDKVKVHAVNQIKNDIGEYPSPNTVKSYQNKIPIVDSYSKEAGNAYSTDLEGNIHFYDMEAAIKTNMFTIASTRSTGLKLKEVYT